MKFPWKYILVSLAIGLLLGGAAGLFCSRSLAERWMKKGPEKFLRHLDHELHLTDPQRTQILLVLNAKREKIASYQDDIRKTTRAEIRGLLTPDQQSHFDAMVARHDATRREREGR